MLHGAEPIGATLHRIVDGGIDTGPVIRIGRIPTDYGSSYLASELRLYGPGCELLTQASRAIGAGSSLAASPQTPGGRCFSTPGIADIRAFRNRGLSLADGLEPAEVECRKT